MKRLAHIFLLIILSFCLCVKLEETDFDNKWNLSPNQLHDCRKDSPWTTVLAYAGLAKSMREFLFKVIDYTTLQYYNVFSMVLAFNHKNVYIVGSAKSKGEEFFEAAQNLSSANGCTTYIGFMGDAEESTSIAKIAECDNDPVWRGDILTVETIMPHARKRMTRYLTKSAMDLSANIAVAGVLFIEEKKRFGFTLEGAANWTTWKSMLINKPTCIAKHKDRLFIIETKNESFSKINSTEEDQNTLVQIPYSL